MITVKHSGHIGDVIYSLPAVKAIAETRKEKVTYYLHQGVLIPTDYDNGSPKPALSKEFAEFIKPLIEAQPYIEKCMIYINGTDITVPLDYDLDMFRRLPVNFWLGHLPLYYMHLTGYFTDYSAPWLTVKEEDKNDYYRDKVIIGRSPRNINPDVDFSILNKIEEKIYFVGTADEYLSINKIIPRIEYIKVSDAYEMACLIASCKLYIGNSSFNFALAEGLKKTRLFEMNLKIQSLMPCGNVKYFTNTEQLISEIL